MEPTEYQAMLKINKWPRVDMDPALLEHAERCPLATEECAICREGAHDFKVRWFAEQDRRAANRKPWSWREKGYNWYKTKSSKIRERIWIWRGCHGRRPGYTDDGILDELLDGIRALNGWRHNLKRSHQQKPRAPS